MNDIQRYDIEFDKYGDPFMDEVHPHDYNYDEAYIITEDHLKAIEAKDKEIENLKGQYKTLDIGFDKSLQINATQTKEIESLKAEVERLRQKQSDDSCKLCNWTCQQCGVFVDECDVLDDETHKGCGGICL